MATKQIKVRGHLGRVIRTRLSYYGNPHHDIVVILEDGDVLWGKTCVNGAIGYGIRNGGEGEGGTGKGVDLPRHEDGEHHLRLRERH